MMSDYSEELDPNTARASRDVIADAIVDCPQNAAPDEIDNTIFWAAGRLVDEFGFPEVDADIDATFMFLRAMEDYLVRGPGWFMDETANRLRGLLVAELVQR